MKLKSKDNAGRELANNLAGYLQSAQWMTWVEMKLGPVVLDPPQADVLAVLKSYSNVRFVIYEVKTSRSDFLSDVNRGKYLKYFEHCTQLYFAVPSGLVTKEEVPAHCGLIVKGEKGWHVVKAATRRDFMPTVDILLKLLMRGYENRMVEWRQYERLKNLEYKTLKQAARDHGIRIAENLGQAEELIRTAEELREKIGELMGKKYETLWHGAWELKGDIEHLIRQKQYLSETVELSDLVLNLSLGRRFFADNVPTKLREIAGRLESKFATEEKI